MSQLQSPVSPRALRASRGRPPWPFNMTPQPNVPGLMVQPVSDVAPHNVPGLTGLMVQPVSDAPLGNGYNNRM